MGHTVTYEDLRTYRDKDIASDTLEALENTIITCQKGIARDGHRGFNNDDVIFMIKAWKKATEVRMGYSTDDWIMYRFKREPAKLAGNTKRSDVLWYSVSNFRGNMENRDYYDRARDAMLNFVWDYHRKITDVDQITDFVAKLNMTIAAGLSGLVQEALIPFESHI